MSSNLARAHALEAALRAGLAGDRTTLAGLLTEDVRAWTPRLTTASSAELLDELDRREPAFTQIELTVHPLDVGGDFACAEWTVEMAHTAPLELGDGTVIEPSGIRVAVHGVTVAEFDGDRICAIRQYWDESALFDQLVLPDVH